MTAPKITRLETCPKCRAAGYIYQSSGSEQWHAECVEDGCIEIGSSFDTEQQAITAWNTRAPTAPETAGLQPCGCGGRAYFDLYSHRGPRIRCGACQNDMLYPRTTEGRRTAIRVWNNRQDIVPAAPEVTRLKLAADGQGGYYIPEPDRWASENPEVWEALRTGRAGVYEVDENGCPWRNESPNRYRTNIILKRLDTPFKSEAKGEVMK